MKKYFILLMLLVPSIALAGAYVDIPEPIEPPALKDVLIAQPPAEPQKIIERTETIREVEKPITQTYGTFLGFHANYPAIGYAQENYSVTSGVRIKNNNQSVMLRMSGKIADLSNKTLTVTTGLALFPGASDCSYALFIGGEKYLADKLALYTDIDILSGGNGNSAIGGVELGGRYFF